MINPTNSFRSFAWHFFKQQYVKLSGMILFMMFVGAVPAIDSMIIKSIVDVVESIPDSKVGQTFELMFGWAVTYAVWWGSLNILWRVYDLLYLAALPKVKANVTREFFDYCLSHSNKFYHDNLIGSLSNRISQATESMEMVFAIGTERLLRKMTTILIAIIAMYYVHYIFGVIMLVWVVFFVGFSSLFMKKINARSMQFAQNQANTFGKIVDSLSNMSSIRMFGAKRFESKYLTPYLQKNVYSERSLQRLLLGIRAVQGTTCTVMLFFMIYYLIYLRSLALVSVGDFVLVLYLSIEANDAVWESFEDLEDFFTEVGVVKQALSILTPHDITDAKNAKSINIVGGEIEFRNVTFRYKYNHNLFENHSVKIEAKQKVGLVGFSGSGKTSFVSLITRLYDIESGEILIDGQDVKDVKLASLCGHISNIPQAPSLFNRTILENIRYNQEEASFEQVVDAAQAANIHEFITSLPDGYDTMCDEGGKNFSRGQKQRMIIARAILKNSPILILDEATSALDTVTEKHIQDSLHKLMAEKTVLVVAHRLNTLLEMDRILVFDKGKIVEDGTHQDLLKDEDGVYASLWNSQKDGFLDDQGKKGLR